MLDETFRPRFMLDETCRARSMIVSELAGFWLLSELAGCLLLSELAGCLLPSELDGCLLPSDLLLQDATKTRETRAGTQKMMRAALAAKGFAEVSFCFCQP